MPRAHPTHGLELDNDHDHDNYPPLLDPQTLGAKIFLVARAISLFVLLGLVAGSAQILGLVWEGGAEGAAEAPGVMVVLLVVVSPAFTSFSDSAEKVLTKNSQAAAGMAQVLLSLACLATRRLPSLAMIWVVDLLFSAGLVALVVLLATEFNATCDAGEGPFGFEGPVEWRGDVCKKLSMAWVLGMAGGGLFVVSGVTAGVVHCNQRENGRGGDVERGWAVEGWRLEGLGEGLRYPVDAWAHQVSQAARGFEEEGYDHRMMPGPGPSRGGLDDSVQGTGRPSLRQGPSAQRTSISSTLSRTFEYDETRGRAGNTAAQQSAQPNSFTS